MTRAGWYRATINDMQIDKSEYHMQDEELLLLD